MTLALVVDDSQFMRTVVGGVLEDDGYEVVEASDGEGAIEAVRDQDPDVITMDVEMPGMNGIEAVEHIMDWQPTPVLMLSAHTQRGADATFEALSKGAVDFLAKPDGEEVSTEAPGLEDDLVEKIHAVEEADVSSISPASGSGDVELNLDSPDGGPTMAGAGGGGTQAEAAAPAAPEKEATADDIAAVIEEQFEREYVQNPTIVVGASTGGPKVIEGLVTDLPASLDARLLIVQHMPEGFTQRLAARLNEVSGYDVREAADGARIGGGEALVAKGGKHMEVSSYSSGRLRVRLGEDERRHGVRPAIDVTMETAAEAVDDPLVGVVLTGMGKDGAAGIEAIADAGGTTFAQDEETSPVYGIPEQAVETGAVDEVLADEDLADGILAALSTDGDT